MNNIQNMTKYNNSFYDSSYMFIAYLILIYFLSRYCNYCNDYCHIYCSQLKIKFYNPKFNYVIIEEEIYDICSICLEKIDNKCIKLDCGHCYHKKCIIIWVKEVICSTNTNANCPICKKEIVIL